MRQISGSKPSGYLIWSRIQPLFAHMLENYHYLSKNYTQMEHTLEKIYRAGMKFLVPLSTQETYDVIIHEALKLADAHYGSIFLEENGELKRVHTSDRRMESIKPRDNGYTMRIYRTGKPQLISSQELEKINPTSRGLGIKSTLFIPLSYQNNSVGVLSIHRINNKSFTKEQLHMLELFGSYISLAIRKTQLNSELTETLKSRDLFIAMAAHELRTPLTSVSGYIQLLFNRYSDQDTVEANWIKQLYWESIRLNNLAKELLEINQVRSGRLSFFWEERDFNEIITRAMATSKFTYPSRKIILKDLVNKPVVKIVGDFDKLIQVITNVIENAAKNSPENSLLEVVFQEQKKYYTVCVIDKGRGIPKKDIEKIGREFYKGESNRAEGMGLGLYLANYIIDHHKGMLKIKSRVNVGTRVFISIPKIQDGPNKSETQVINP